MTSAVAADEPAPPGRLFSLRLNAVTAIEGADAKWRTSVCRPDLGDPMEQAVDEQKRLTQQVNLILDASNRV